MLRSIELRGVGPVAELDAELGSRLNVITGDNGLGKSFFLDTCFWALTGTWPGGKIALPEPGDQNAQATIAYKIGEWSSFAGSQSWPFRFNYPTQVWERPESISPVPVLTLYAAADGSFTIWDKARNHRRGPNPRIWKFEKEVEAYQFSPETLANGLADGSRVLCQGLIKDWVEWWLIGQAPLASRLPHAFDYLREVIDLLSHPSEPISCDQPTRIYLNDTRPFPTLRFPYGVVPYPHWSAGVKRIMSLAYLLVWAWVEHEQAAALRHETPTNQIVLIIDEVESHLHPKWQRTILPALLKVAAKLRADVNVQIIATTHSPLVLASLEPHFDSDTDSFFRFDLQDDQVTFSDIPWAIHGDMVGWLTSDIFGLDQARSREAEQAIEAAEAFMRGDVGQLPPHLQTKEAINRSLQRLLPNLDPFWPRWLTEAHA